MYYQFKKRSFIRSHLGIVNRVRTNPEKSTRISYCINYCVSHSVLSDSLRSHALQPARLLCPWNSPGKNTGVSSHSLLQGIFLTRESNPGFPALQADSLLSEPPGKPQVTVKSYSKELDPQHSRPSTTPMLCAKSLHSCSALQL